MRRKDGAIHVCPLSAMPDTVARSKASHVLTWLQDEIVVETPPLILPERHIRFHIHDISEPLVGYAAPGREHIDELIEFALDWGGRGPIVVHCWAGISRSTAAAYTALCAINPDASEARDRHALARGLADRLPEPPDDPPRRRGAGPRAAAWSPPSSHGSRRRRRRGGAVLHRRRPFAVSRNVRLAAAVDFAPIPPENCHDPSPSC